MTKSVAVAGELGILETAQDGGVSSQTLARDQHTETCA